MTTGTIYDELENPPEHVSSADYRRGRADMREQVGRMIEGMGGKLTADGSLISRAEVMAALETTISDDEIRAANEAERQALQSITDPGDPDSGLSPAD